MSTAIWMISYAVGEPDRPGYAEWFHRVHIPEKLARPGYAAAAHYEALDGAGRYVALFRAVDARAFLAPTPGQLKQRQDALTKKMMGMRVGSCMAILAEAIRVPAPQEPDAPVAAAVRLSLYEYADAAAEDAAAGWLVQERLPELACASGLRGASLLLFAAGRGRHALLEEYDSAAALAAQPGRFPATANHVSGSPFEGRRICPAL
jgi:hypothetical protein